MTLGKRLREVREAVGLTQTEFGAVGDVKKFAQIKFEQDKQVPGGKYLLLLHDAGYDVAYILTGVRAASTPAEAALLDNYRAACSEQQVQLLDASRALANSAITTDKKISKR